MAGMEKFHIGVTNTYLSAKTNCPPNSARRPTFEISIGFNSFNGVPDLSLFHPLKTSASRYGISALYKSR